MRSAKFMAGNGRGPGAMAAAWAVLASAALSAGETMRESAPTRPKTALERNGRPIDPLLERLANPAQLKAGRDESTLVNPLLTPRPNQGVMDPLLQKQWQRETERQRNWLLENAVQIANPAKGPGGPENERSVPTLKDKLEANSPASVRYLHARDAALANEARRSMTPDPARDPGRSALSPESASLHESFARDERPLDTSRIIQHGGDPAAIPVRQQTGSATSPLLGKDSAPVDLGVATGLADARKTALNERNSAFESLLETPVSSTMANSIATPKAPGDSKDTLLDVVGLETRRGPAASRARQFDAMLAGGEATASSMGSAARALSAPGAAIPSARTMAIPDLVKPPGQGLGRPSASPLQRPAEKRFQPLPAILEQPRFDQ